MVLDLSLLAIIYRLVHDCACNLKLTTLRYAKRVQCIQTSLWHNEMASLCAVVDTMVSDVDMYLVEFTCETFHHPITSTLCCEL